MATNTEVRKALTEAFKVFDRDGNGTINSSELREVVTAVYRNANKPINMAEINSTSDEFLAQADTNSDGKIGRDEFVNFFEDILS